MSKPVFQPNLQTYSEQITSYIKQLLLEGKLKPGDKVNEVQLANSLSISRAPVREALQVLVTEGLIVSIPQRGKYIAALTAKEICDSYAVGGALEGIAVSACINDFTTTDLKELENIVKEMASLSKENYTEGVSSLDIKFHNLLLAKNDNRLLIEQARLFCQRLSKFLLYRHWPSQFSQKEVVRRHQAIIDAIRAKDAWQLEEIIREHYNSLAERMSKYGSDA